MSKAFTRESDDAPERPVAPRPVSALPPGAKNYLTPDGAGRFRAELARLGELERPALAAATDADSRERLRTLDQRIAQLEAILRTAVVSPPPADREQVKFGATIRVRERDGEEAAYRIVGVDETDIDRGWISWLSPLARALMNARARQRVRFKSPAGEQEMEIVSISYEAGSEN